MFLKQSTAVDIKLGPFVDSGDGVTAETSLTISQADVRLAKNNGSWAQKNDNTALTHEENGWYECELDSTDTNTVGILKVAVNESGALPVWETFIVLPANVYDSLVGGTDNLQADMIQIEGTDATDALATALALGVADLPTNAELATALGTADDAVLTAIDNLPTNAELTAALASADDAVLAAIAALNNTSVAQILSTALTESYAANGAEPTLTQMLYAIHQYLMGFAITGTAYSVKELDGSTEAFEVTLNDATTPTAATRS